MRAGIIGAGIMGQLLALELHQAGWQVSIFDKGDGISNCSHVAAGLLTPYSELDKSPSIICELGKKSIQDLWPRILKLIPEDVYYQQSGCIVVNHPQDQAEWEHFSRRIVGKIPNKTAYIEHLSHNALIHLEPGLEKFAGAYFFPEEAHIDSQSLLAGLKHYLQHQGVRFFMHTQVTTFKPKCITTKNEAYAADMVFDCRGLDSKDAFSDLRGLRGELIWLHAPEVSLQRPVRLLHPRYSLYIVPRPGNIYLIGASEIESEDASPISVRTTLELLTAVFYLHAGFAEARILKTQTQCRPTLSNHLPRIKRSEGLIAVNGLYRHGYLIAPALACEIVQSLASSHYQPDYPSLWEHYDA